MSVVPVRPRGGAQATGLRFSGGAAVMSESSSSVATVGLRIGLAVGAATAAAAAARLLHAAPPAAASVGGEREKERGGVDSHEVGLDGDEALRTELEGMRLKQLWQRAAAEGVGEGELTDALDADNPKAGLIALVVKHVASKGPAERMLHALLCGGDACVKMLSSVLEHGMHVLERVSASSPRKSRRSLLDVCDRVEQALDSMDVAWC
eukprot:COSAG02_NODE_15869_length_1134_cov_11.089213_1_plen_207_part_10